MALKTRGKLLSLGLATFGAAAAADCPFGHGSSSDSGAASSGDL